LIIVLARARRVRSPPDRAATLRSAASPEKPNEPRTLRRLRSRSAVPAAAWISCSVVRSRSRASTWCCAKYAVADVGADGARALHRCEVAEQQAQQRRLARAVGADEGHLLAPLDREVDVAQDGHAVVADGDVDQLGHEARRPLRRREAEAGDAGAVVGHLDAVQLLQRLDAALDLAGLRGLVAEALHEALDVGYVPCLPVGEGTQPGQPILPLHDELGEAADVPVAVRGGLDDPLGDGVDEAQSWLTNSTARRADRVSSRPLSVRGGWSAVEDEDLQLGQQQTTEAARIRHPPDMSVRGRAARPKRIGQSPGGRRPRRRQRAPRTGSARRARPAPDQRHRSWWRVVVQPGQPLLRSCTSGRPASTRRAPSRPATR
jgi:hypothetical protein